MKHKPQEKRHGLKKRLQHGRENYLVLIDITRHVEVKIGDELVHDQVVIKHDDLGCRQKRGGVVSERAAKTTLCWTHTLT